MEKTFASNSSSSFSSVGSAEANVLGNMPSNSYINSPEITEDALEYIAGYLAKKKDIPGFGVVYFLFNFCISSIVTQILIKLLYSIFRDMNFSKEKHIHRLV